ncbi:hypothetical protein WA026_017630 [Henosepilachna vigintioctopunctata]|uniref:Invertebrate defensins family profile domain-containing protein n=1 Tax=Henosepilachna vigintioctopunctata TaxID=420089 RepID=A0AAW1V3M8_9CUCU
MSDFEDDSECLKIHLAGKFSESSDSGDDNELDEEYHLLRPSPIPADIIRQKSIYRPPSPIKDANNCNLLYSSKENSSVIRVKGISCDVLSFSLGGFQLNNSLCALNCIRLGTSGGYCENGACLCRKL